MDDVFDDVTRTVVARTLCENGERTTLVHAVEWVAFTRKEHLHQILVGVSGEHEMDLVGVGCHQPVRCCTLRHMSVLLLEA